MEAQGYNSRPHDAWLSSYTASSVGECIRGRRAHTFIIDDYPVYNFTACDFVTRDFLFGDAGDHDHKKTPTIEISEAEFMELITKYDNS